MVEVWDKDTFSKDDFLGRKLVDLTQVFQNANVSKISKNIEIQRK